MKIQIIEIVWAIWKPRVIKDDSRDKEKIKDVVLKVWKELPDSLFRNLVLSMEKRIETLKETQGRPTLISI